MDTSNTDELNTDTSGHIRVATSKRAPKSVRLAVIAVFALAAVQLMPLWGMFTGEDRSHVDRQIYNAFPGVAISSAQLATAETVFRLGVLLGALVIAVLLVWLGFKTRAGRRWARISVTLILVLGLVRLLPSAGHQSTLSGQVIELFEMLAFVAAPVLLWLPDSGAFFGRRSSAS